MLLKVFHTRVELQDNVGNTMAVLAFPEVAEGVCEMHDIYLNVDEIKESARNKMITYALVQIRKNNWQVIPAGQEISAWFDSHPSDCDLLRSAANPQPQPVVEPQVQQEEPVQQAQPASVAAPVAEAVSQGTTMVAQGTKKAASGALRVFGRFLQVLSAACMVGIIGVFGLNWFRHLNIAYWMFGQPDQRYWIFLIANVAFAFFCFLFLFWILSTKGYYQDDREIRIDTGRGITAFILVLLVYAGCFVVVKMFAYLIPGLAEYVQMFVVQLTYIPILAAVGFGLSIIRRMIGR